MASDEQLALIDQLVNQYVILRVPPVPSIPAVFQETRIYLSMSAGDLLGHFHSLADLVSNFLLQSGNSLFDSMLHTLSSE